MARAATTLDVFNAVAEPRRREILDVLGDGRERAVSEVVEAVGMPQPSVSKHLSVLLKVGVVTVTRNGQMRMYRLNGSNLKPVHDWVKTFEQYWSHQIDRIKERAEQKMRDHKKQADNQADNKEEV
ncbi:MAG TPA: metalloregulator ArsR/SmtB family transcription factor [Acidobacteriaceae bacterium]|jgi:DNA-binding transcriptional ArsR family regulator|nr:metalloregulator ArsR/SmtB family transcription factor [Acidobacteriaceae bacterium]